MLSAHEKLWLREVAELSVLTAGTSAFKSARLGAITGPVDCLLRSLFKLVLGKYL